MTPFPWKQAIGFGLGVLRLPPEQFWRMTPRELSLCDRSGDRTFGRRSTATALPN